MTPIVLREYQTKCVDQLRDGIRAGHRKQILMAPAGAGKTECAAYLTKLAQERFSRVAFIVDRVVLCDQTSARFERYGISHGVMQAGHWRYRPHERVQVCSAQTLERRGFPQADLIIVDEAHCMRKATTELLKRTDATVIGLTATPFAKGMGSVYSNLVNVTTTDDLVKQGFLVPLRMYAARAVDMTGAKVIAGEWAEDEIEKRGIEIIGDIVGEWIDKTRLHFGGPVKTIVFSATVEHGNQLCRQFQAAGYDFQQISYKDTNDERRREIIAEFAKPDSTIHGLVSCEVFTKGFDVPDIRCGIAARPYRKSLSSHIQQMGRAMRPAPDKTFALWLDHCGNLLRFRADTEDIFANGMHKLDEGEHDNKVRQDPDAKKLSEIKCSCGYLMAPYMERCPGCGKERVRHSMVDEVAGVLVEIGPNGKELEPYLRDRASVWQQLCRRAMERTPTDPERAKKWALANYREFYGSWPEAVFNPAADCPMDIRLAGKLKSKQIRWVKGRQKREAQGAAA